MEANTLIHTEQTNDHTIKFTHGVNAVIDTNNGSTVFANLFMLGAFANTREYEYGHDTVNIKYATDTVGLEVLESKAEETLSCLACAVTALGTIMAHVDMDELDKGTINSYAWLIAGLGELTGQVAFESSEISAALRHAKPVKNGQEIA